MHLLLFYRSLKQGGVQRMMLNLANHMVAKGHCVTILLFRREGPFLELLDKRVNVIGIESDSFYFILKYLIRLLKSKSYDLLFSATPGLNIAAIIANMIAKVNTKVVISERSNTIKEFSGSKFGPYKLSFFLIPILYRFANAILTVSEGVKRDLIKISFVKNEKVDVVYNPAFESNFQEQLDNEVNHEWFQKDRKENQIPVVIGAGRLHYQKNFELLIQSIVLLNKRRPVRLIIIGEGEEYQKLQDLIVSLDATSFIRLEGFQINPISWIGRSNVFVLSSRWEGFGNILVDALAAQTTIVTTDCKSGPAEIIEGGKYGYLLKREDAEEMSQIIELAIENPMNKELLLNRARFFDKETAMLRYEKIFNNLLGA